MFSRLLALFFPVRCACCGAALPHDDACRVCPACAGRIRLASGPVLRPVNFRHVEFIRSGCVYEGPARELLRKFKYGGRDYLSGFLAKTLIYALNSEPRFAEADAVVAVPLHWTRRLARGYNQSELLAREAAQYLGKPLLRGALARSRKTLPQFHLSRAERLENLRGCFSVRGRAAVKGKKLLLVDDICTTAATLEECARALRKAGASKVFGLTAARDA